MSRGPDQLDESTLRLLLVPGLGPVTLGYAVPEINEAVAPPLWRFGAPSMRPPRPKSVA